jgi:hypothetical protein
MILFGFLAGLISNTTPGAINMATTDLVRRRLWWSVVGYILLVVGAETAYAYGCLASFDFLQNRPDILLFLKRFGYVMLMLLGLWMLVAQIYQNREVPTGALARGITASLVHPHQIPYWLVISAMLPDWQIDLSQPNTIHSLIWSNALGTLISMLCYVGVGLLPPLFVNRLLHLAQIIVGLVYVAVAIFGLAGFF